MENKQNNAKVAFFYCLSIVALVIFAIGVGTAFFSVIDKLMPNLGAAIYDSGSQPLKFAIASIVIAGPLYYWLVWRLRKDLLKNFYDFNNGPRRWLTYLLLLISSVTILGSLVRLLYSYLDGDLTWRFALKAVTVLFLAVIIFVYYFYDLKVQPKKGDWIIKTIFYVALLFTLSAFVLAVIYSESPSLARARRIDQKTLIMLDKVEMAINSYYAKNKSLPANQEAIMNNNETGLLASDWQNNDNGAIIKYQAEKKLKYKLCSSFDLSSDWQTLENDYLGRRWQHKQGQNCFSRTVDQFNSKNLPIEALPIQ
jgi:hypothetical protein